MTAAADAFMGIFGFKRVEFDMEKLIEDLRNHAAARTGYTTALIGKAADALESQAREIAGLQKLLDRTHMRMDELKAQPSGVVAWLPIDTAPRDGSLVRLLVEFEDHATEDQDGPCPTIGANNHDNDGEDVWLFAGWDWSHDLFTQGIGHAIGWLPMLESLNQPASGGDERAALRYTSDGALAECPCCGSLDVGGAQDTVNCYGCGLQITKPRPLQNAADAWNKRAALAQSERVPAWIPVSELLPAILREVMVAYESDDDGEPCLDVGTATRMSDGKWHSAGTFYAMGKVPCYEVRAHSNRVVTHWMPLPAAPSPSKQGGV